MSKINNLIFNIQFQTHRMHFLIKENCNTFMSMVYMIHNIYFQTKIHNIMWL